MINPLVAILLAQGKDAIVERGWRQGLDGPGVCMYEALCVPNAPDEIIHQASDVLTQSLNRKSHHFCVIDWNDEPGRTVEEVLAAFDKAIEEVVRSQPVAWRVKDPANGWIVFQDQRVARWYADITDAQIQELFVEQIERAVPQNAEACGAKGEGGCEDKGRIPPLLREE